MNSIIWENLQGCCVIIKDDNNHNLKGMLVDPYKPFKVYIENGRYEYANEIEIDYNAYIGRKVKIMDFNMWNDVDGVLKRVTDDGYFISMEGNDVYAKNIIPILYDDEKYFAKERWGDKTLEETFPNFQKLFNKFCNIFIRVNNKEELEEILTFFNNIGYTLYNPFLLYKKDLVLYTDEDGLIYSEATLVPKFTREKREIFMIHLNTNVDDDVINNMITDMEELVNSEIKAQKIDYKELDKLIRVEQVKQGILTECKTVSELESEIKQNSYKSEEELIGEVRQRLHREGFIANEVIIIDEYSKYNGIKGFLKIVDNNKKEKYCVVGYTSTIGHFTVWVEDVHFVDAIKQHIEQELKKEATKVDKLDGQNYDFKPIVEKHQDKVGQTVIIDDMESIYHNFKGVFVGYCDDIKGGKPFQIQIANGNINENTFTFVSNVIFKVSGQKFSQNKLPMFTVLFKQFPDALKEVVKASQAGHKKYADTDFDWMNFKRVPNENFEYLNAMIRHLMEYSSGVEYVEDMKEYGEVLEFAAVIWNGLAHLQRMIEDSK